MFSRAIFGFSRCTWPKIALPPPPNISPLLSRSSHEYSLFKTRTHFLLQHCNELTGEEDCWSLIHRIRVIPSSTALLKGWPSHIVGGQPQFLTYSNITNLCYYRVYQKVYLCSKMSHLKLK